MATSFFYTLYYTLIENYDCFTSIEVIFYIIVLPRFISYFLKVFWQTWFLLWGLLWISKPNFYLVQNPPSVPTLPVCWFVAKIKKVQLTIDWHNYGMYNNFFFVSFKQNCCLNWKSCPWLFLCCYLPGYTILGLALGRNHILVKVSHFLEAFFGRRANFCFCVTKAMKQDLLVNWGVW